MKVNEYHIQTQHKYSVTKAYSFLLFSLLYLMKYEIYDYKLRIQTSSYCVFLTRVYIYFFVVLAHGICNYIYIHIQPRKPLTRFSNTQGHAAHISVP